MASRAGVRTWACAAGLVALLLADSPARGEPIRIVEVGPDGNARAAQQACLLGDLVCTYQLQSETVFNALTPPQLRAMADVLIIPWDSSAVLNADYNTRLKPFLQLNGGVIFESPTNLVDLAVIASGPINTCGTTIVSSSVPVLTTGITNSFVNCHFELTSWDTTFLHAFLVEDNNVDGLYGTVGPGSHGRIVITGTDSNYHGVPFSSNAGEANMYELVVNEIAWIALPEPSLLPMLGVGSAAVCALRRRRAA